MSSFDRLSVAKAREMVERAREKMARVREHAEEAIGYGIQAVEVSGTTFGFGWANGRWGGAKGQVELLGVPADLGAAVAFHGIAFMGGLGKHAEHGHNLGTGALASYANRLGMQLGQEAARREQQAKGAAYPVANPVANPGAFNGAPQHAVAGWADGVAYTVHADAEE